MGLHIHVVYISLPPIETQMKLWAVSEPISSRQERDFLRKTHPYEL